MQMKLDTLALVDDGCSRTDTPLSLSVDKALKASTTSIYDLLNRTPQQDIKANHLAMTDQKSNKTE